MPQETLHFRFDGDASGFQSAIKKSEGSLSKFSARLSGLGGKLRNLGGMMTLGITAPLALMGKSFITAASDAEETASKFTAVFKDLSGEAEDFVQATAGSLGRSTTDLRKYMGTFQDTFVPLGFAREEGLEMSKALTGLTMDLASFNNMSEPETLAALQSAIVGNHETMRQYGVIINQAGLDQELLNMGIQGGAKSATEAQKAQARLNLIIAGTSDAQGDALRTSGSFANQMRRLGGQFTEFAEEIGNIVIPVIKKVIKFFGDIIEKFRNLPGEMKILAIALAGIAMAAGPVIAALGMVLSPVGLIIAGIITLGTVVYKNFNAILGFIVQVINEFINLYNNSLVVRLGFELIRTTILSIVDAAGIAATGGWEMFKKAGSLILGVFKGVGNAIVAILTGNWDDVGDIMKDTLTGALDDFQSIGKTYADMWKKQGESLADNFTEGYKRVMENKMEKVSVEGIKGALSDGIETIKGWVLEKAKELGFEIPQSITDAINKAAEKAKTEGVDGKGGKEDPKDEFELMTRDMYMAADERNKRMASMNAQFNSTIQSGVSDMIAGLAQTIATGGNVMDAFKGMIGGFMQDIGKQFIQFGIAELIFATLLAQPPTPPQAIALVAAGALLVALGAQISSSKKKMASSGSAGEAIAVPAMAKGGIVTGPTLALIGEAGPEAVVPLDKLGGMGANRGEFILRGQDLVLALNRADNFKNRIMN